MKQLDLNFDKKPITEPTKKWDILKRLSDKDHPKFTTKILEVKNGGTGKRIQSDTNI